MVIKKVVEPANWCKTVLDCKPNTTTNSYISQDQHDRQICEYDAGELDITRDRLLGETL